MLDFEFCCDLCGMGGVHVCHGDKASLRYQSAQVLRVPLTHFTDSKNANPQLVHAQCSQEILAL
jgi:hypothetical protein